MILGRALVLLGALGAVTVLSAGVMAADLHRRHAHHARHYLAPEAPVVPPGYAYGGYQRGYGYVVPGQGYDGPGFGFPGY